MNFFNNALRLCKKGHRYHKSNCPSCPICEKNYKPKNSFLSMLPPRARHSLKNSGITTVMRLSKYSKKDIIKLNGIGVNTMVALEICLE